MRKTIYLKQETTLIEILEKLKEITEKETVLVIPPENREFNKEITFEILKSESTKLDKKIIISSNDKKIIKLAKKYNFETILPEEKIKRYVKEVFTSKPTHFPTHFPKEMPVQRKKTKTFLPKFFIFLVLLLIVVLGVYFLGFYVAEANLELTLQKSVKPFDYDFDISSSIVKSSSDFLTLKGVFVSQNLPLSNSYPVKNETSVLTRASGYVIISNTGQSFSLIPNTRFITEDGKIFRSQEKIIIPEGSEQKPSLTKIYVVADRPGEEYNISPTKFKIPGLSGTIFEKNITVYSEENFAGGGSKILKVPSFEDYSEVQKNFDSDARIYAENYLNKNYNDVLFFPEAKLISITINRIEPQDVKIVTTSIDNLKVIGEIKINALGIRLQEVEEMIKDLEAKFIEENFFINKVQIEKMNLTSYDLNEGKGKLKVSGKIYVQFRFNESEFKKQISGKTLDEVYQILREKKGLTQAKVTLWPFWIKKIPNNLEKIKILIQ